MFSWIRDGTNSLIYWDTVYILNKEREDDPPPSSGEITDQELKNYGLTKLNKLQELTP